MPSSVILTMHYYPAVSTLRVIFVSGLIYDYKNVPEKIYKEMKASSSKGAYLNQHVKGWFDYKKVS